MVKVGRYHVNTAKKKRFVFHPPPRILPNCKFHSVAKSFKPSPASPNDYQKKKKSYDICVGRKPNSGLRMVYFKKGTEKSIGD